MTRPQIPINDMLMWFKHGDVDMFGLHSVVLNHIVEIRRDDYECDFDYELKMLYRIDRAICTLRFKKLKPNSEQQDALRRAISWLVTPAFNSKDCCLNTVDDEMKSVGLLNLE